VTGDEASLRVIPQTAAGRDHLGKALFIWFGLFAQNLSKGIALACLCLAYSACGETSSPWTE
jgi:hypothetical protein